MTEFARHYLDTLLRARAGALVLACATVLVIQFLLPAAPLAPLFILFGVGVLLTLLVHPLQKRLSESAALHIVILYDLGVIFVVILSSGGTRGGFALLYVLLVTIAALLFGLQWGFVYAFLAALGFAAQVALEIFGVHASPINTPDQVQWILQFAMLGILVSLAFIVLRGSYGMAQRWRGERIQVEGERVLAERAQQRWALINNVALRIQESTTPAQVYARIGEQVEQLGLHCAILEWVEPDVSLRVTYLSLEGKLMQLIRERLDTDETRVRLPLADSPVMEQAIQTRAAVFFDRVATALARYFPRVPRPVLEQLVKAIHANTLIYAPMFNRDRVIGLLAVWGKHLDQEDLLPFAALAQQAASALDKARLLTEQHKRAARLLTEQHKRAAQLALVSAIAARMNTVNTTDEIIQPVVREVGERFGYPVVSIVLVDQARGELYVPATYSTISELNDINSRQPITLGLFGLVARTGETYLARDTRNDPNYFSPHPERDPIRSELVIPLRDQGRVIGVLDVESAQLDAFDPSDVTALTLLAGQVSAALEKSRVLGLEKKRAAQWALTGEIAARAAAFSDPDAIVRTMVQLVQERFGYHHVCLALYDPAQNEMEQRAAAGPSAHLYTIGYRWNANDGLIGLAARTRQTVYSSDLGNDPRYLANPDNVANSALCVPLVSGKNVLGVLDVESEALDGFDANDMSAMETLANQMAAALEKARSLQAERRRAAQLALVNRIASRTARLIPTAQLVREATDLIHSQFGYFNVAVFARENNEAGVQLVANAGALDRLLERDTTRLTTGIIAFVAKNGNSYLCANTHHDPYYVSPFPDRAQDPVESEIAIPLRRGENIIGVLDIQSEQRFAFTPSDITALEALADQLAAAMENARLYESEAQRVAQLDTIRLLALKLTAERNLDTLLHSIVSSAAELVQAQGAMLFMVDETRGDLVVRISYRMARNYVGTRVGMGEGLAGRVAQQGEPQLIANYALWDKRAAVYEGEPLARMISVPLKWQDRVLGVIDLHRELDRPMFNPEELRLANLFAAHAAIAMENANLVSALQSRVHAQQTLSDLSATILDTIEPQAILDQAAVAALRALESDAAFIFLPDGEGGLVARAHAGLVPDVLLDLRLTTEPTSVPGAAYSLQRPTLWSDTDPTSLRYVHSLARRFGFRAGISVPMLVGETVVGVVTVNTKLDRHYQPTEVQTLSLLANQVASALERARYFAQEQRRVQELDWLFEGFRATASTLEPDEVITRLLEQLTLALDVTSAYFIRVDLERGEWEQTHEYFASVAHAHERASAVRTWQTHELGTLMQALAQSVQVGQLADSLLPEPLRHYMRANQVHTILRVPLRAADEMIGYVSLWETRAPRNWSADEIRFVQTMASQAMVALVNAQLYQTAHTRTRELQTLHEASRLLNASLDARTICDTSVDALRDILGYEHVSIYFVENERLRLQVQRGYDTLLDNIPLDQGIMARAVKTRAVVFLDDVSRESNFLAALPNTQSEIAVPLLAGDRALGVLNVETIHGEYPAPRKEFLTLADVQLLTTFANQLVVAIENARLFQETQEGLNQVRTLHAASQAVNADLKLDAVLAQVADQFIAALDVDSCTISEVDLERHEAITLLDRDPLSEVYAPSGTRFPLNATERQLTINSQGHAHAFRADDPQLDPEMGVMLKKFQWRAYILAPLIAKGEILGCVELGERKRERTFDRSELQLAESLANQAALAIQNARLYRDAEQRLQEAETLYHFARELGGTVDIKQLGKRALEAAGRLTDFDVGEVSLLREMDGALVPLVMTGAVGVEQMNQMLLRGVGITGWVAEHGHAARVGDVTRDPRYYAMSPYIMSELCLPLRIGARVIGVLNLEAKAPDAFDAHVEQLLTAFANQLAIAIENARLYEQSKRDAEVKAALLRELSHRVKNNLAAVTSLLYMALDEPPDTREHILNETLGRVQSMSLAHGLLARSGEARVSLLELGRQVLHDTVRNLSQPGVVVETEVEGEEVQIAARQTTTLALVLNELATNALRHGLDGAPEAHLRLRFTVARMEQEVRFQLQDDGKGFAAPFDLESDVGLGLNLVRTLVEKDLHGHFALERRGQWTCADIRFQLEEDVR